MDDIPHTTANITNFMCSIAVHKRQKFAGTKPVQIKTALRTKFDDYNLGRIQFNSGIPGFMGRKL